MKNLLPLITILSGIMAVGYIEDCGGHCLGNENWTMFFVMSVIMLISGVLSVYTMVRSE